MKLECGQAKKYHEKWSWPHFNTVSFRGPHLEQPIAPGWLGALIDSALSTGEQCHTLNHLLHLSERPKVSLASLLQQLTPLSGLIRDAGNTRSTLPFHNYFLIRCVLLSTKNNCKFLLYLKIRDQAISM